MHYGDGSWNGENWKDENYTRHGKYSQNSYRHHRFKNYIKFHPISITWIHLNLAIAKRFLLRIFLLASQACGCFLLCKRWKERERMKITGGSQEDERLIHFQFFQHFPNHFQCNKKIEIMKLSRRANQWRGKKNIRLESKFSFNTFNIQSEMNETIFPQVQFYFFEFSQQRLEAKTGQIKVNINFACPLKVEKKLSH